jgi:phosphoglycerate dehydrogenase-like enzyme
MAEPLVIWTNADLEPAAIAALKDGTAGHRLVVSERSGNNLATGSASAQLAEADVAFGQPDPDQIAGLGRLKWIQLTSAGYTRYDRPDLFKALKDRGANLTNSSSVFDDPCAQHVLAFMLAQARQLPESYAAQLSKHEWVYNQLRNKTRVLRDETVLILGFGAIARRLVELLAPYHLKLVATRRTVKGDEGIEVHSISELEALLPMADHVVNVLPSNPSADGIMDASKFAAMKPGASFYNVGRGATVDQDALIGALKSGRLASAYLDVAVPEPLPSDHPLWTTPNCYVTPHIAGGHQEEDLELVRHFLANLERFARGDELKDRVV